jgi:hypothetical protein
VRSTALATVVLPEQSRECPLSNERWGLHLCFCWIEPTKEFPFATNGVIGRTGEGGPSAIG